MSHLKEIKVPQHSPRRVGIVESDARDKSRRVAVSFTVKHPKYGKYMRRRTTVQVHDAQNVSKKGDRVEIAECRPISKTKSWIVLRVVKAAAAPAPPLTEDAAER